MNTPQRRRVAWALAASVLLHLLLLAAYLRMAEWYRLQDLRPTRYLPDLLLLAPSLFRQEAIGRLPERPLEKAAAPEAQGQPALPFVEAIPEALDPGAPPPPDGALAVPGARQPVFVPQPSLGDFSLNEADIAAVARLRDQVDRYARYWSPDVDTTDAASRSRSRAEAIVLRAFAAMGGLDELLKIREMDVVVWVVAFETLRGEGRQARLDTVAPYPYPIATWHMHGLGKVERDVFRVAFDLGSGKPFPPYATKNPEATRQAYYELFDARWLLSAPLPTRKLRHRSEDARWHVTDRFLGEGIRLAYVGAGRLDVGFGRERPVYEIRVDDRKYGGLMDAYFDRDTGLLLGVREELSESEQAWSRQKTARSAPAWITSYDDYRQVGQVLLPHRWVRSVTPPPPRALRRRHRVELRLNIGLNGAAPDTVAPDL